MSFHFSYTLYFFLIISSFFVSYIFFFTSSLLCSFLFQPFTYSFVSLVCFCFLPFLPFYFLHHFLLPPSLSATKDDASDKTDGKIISLCFTSYSLHTLFFYFSLSSSPAFHPSPCQLLLLQSEASAPSAVIITLHPHPCQHPTQHIINQIDNYTSNAIFSLFFGLLSSLLKFEVFLI